MAKRLEDRYDKVVRIASESKPGESYRVGIGATPELSACTCKAYIFQRKVCKHIEAAWDGLDSTAAEDTPVKVEPVTARKERDAPMIWKDRYARRRGHSLMSLDAAKKLPSLRTTDGQGDAAIAQVKLFSPYSGWTWYLTEYDPKTGEAFGMTDGFEREWGYINMDELARSTFGPGVPLVERDLYWVPKSVGDALGRTASAPASDSATLPSETQPDPDDAIVMKYTPADIDAAFSAFSEEESAGDAASELREIIANRRANAAESASPSSDTWRTFERSLKAAIVHERKEREEREANQAPKRPPRPKRAPTAPVSDMYDDPMLTPEERAALKGGGPSLHSSAPRPRARRKGPRG